MVCLHAAGRKQSLLSIVYSLLLSPIIQFIMLHCSFISLKALKRSWTYCFGEMKQRCLITAVWRSEDTIICTVEKPVQNVCKFRALLDWQCSYEALFSSDGQLIFVCVLSLTLFDNRSKQKTTSSWRTWRTHIQIISDNLKCYLNHLLMHQSSSGVRVENVSNISVELTNPYIQKIIPSVSICG